MRKIKINIEQVHDALACHLESLHIIRTDEHVRFTPLQIKDGMITLYVSNNKGDYD